MVRAFALFVLCGHSLTVWADQAPSLEQALAERDRGRVFNALDMLDHLRRDTPGSARLQVETAVLYIQLKRYASANQILSEVLTDAGLPARVRVNVQLLQLKARRLLRNQQDSALSLQVEAGAAYSRGQNQSLPLFDTQLGVLHRSRLPAANLFGYPLFSQWVKQAQVSFVNSPDAAISDLSATLTTGLELDLFAYRLVPALDARFTEAGAEPGLNLTAKWRPAHAFNLSGYLSQRWLASGGSENLGEAGIDLFNDQPVRLSFNYRYRFTAGDEPSATTHRLGSELSLHDAGQWVLGASHKLDGPAAEARTAAYLHREHPLSRGFDLLAELRYEHYDNNDATGYGRLGVRWRK
ncbi:hypothetical protein [Saccharospirillum sp.]|uniref:hypothetical protein n=1 Tax=Saccharospirillum sp. TaxID=2033801 RepID=UPI0034A0395C